MSLFYRIAYGIGFAPWENAASHKPAADMIARLFDQEQNERTAPFGKALDLGCGTGAWSVELAHRGWTVTGIDNIEKAIEKARRRAKNANVDVRFFQGDITALRSAGIGDGFQFFWDFGTVHGLTDEERGRAGREITAAAAPKATMVTLAWAPGRRGPLPRGMNRAQIEAAFPDWTIIGEGAFDVTGLPPPLRGVEPRYYRLRNS